MRPIWQYVDGTVTSIQRFEDRHGVWYSIAFTYQVDGHWHSGTFATTVPYAEGERIPIPYDPAHPERTNYSRSETAGVWIYIVLLAGLLIVAVILLHPR